MAFARKIVRRRSGMLPRRRFVLFGFFAVPPGDEQIRSDGGQLVIALLI
jgi:hypothetical protein